MQKRDKCPECGGYNTYWSNERRVRECVNCQLMAMYPDDKRAKCRKLSDRIISTLCPTMTESEMQERREWLENVLNELTAG